MTDEIMQMRQAKKLVAQSYDERNTDAALVSLTLAVNILIGLIEGHRHEYNPNTKVIYDRDTCEYPVTGPMQARQ